MMTIDLPKSQYRILNAPPPTRWVIVATIATILVVAVAWALF